MFKVVLLVDNGSDQPLAEPILDRFPNVILLREETNLGFAGGYNVGIRWALARPYQTFFVLNNDTLLDPRCLAELQEGEYRLGE